jgi:hypothetical protein
MKLKFIKIFFLIAAFNMCCDESFLEVTPKANVSDATAWSSFENANLFLTGIYGNIPTDFLLFGWDPFDNWTDNQIPSFHWTPSMSQVAKANYTDVSSPANSWWTSGYRTIRSCNLLIEKVGESKALTETEKQQLIGQARFLRAYFYSWLANFFGGVPIITEAQNRFKDSELEFPRSSYEETVNLIREELTEAARVLPPSWNEANEGRATSGAALALRSEVELYAASVLDSEEMYRACVETSQEVMSMNYTLMEKYEEIFLPEFEKVNNEVIFEVHFDGQNRAHDADVFLSPRVDPPTKKAAGWGHITPTQELVDAYEFTDGKPGDDPSHADNPYVDRDDRFYASILYDGSEWRGATIHTRYNPDIPKGVDDNSVDIEFEHLGTRTGYYFRKYLDPKIEPAEVHFYGKSVGENNAILLRLGEILLNYAEAQNEVAGPDASVYEAINQLRRRGGLPDLPAGLSQEQMRERIRNERRIELAFEGKRYWDIIRWKIAPEVLNKNLTGIKIIEQPDGSLVYERFPAKEAYKQFNTPVNYLFPIPADALSQNFKLQQNPGY